MNQTFADSGGVFFCQKKRRKPWEFSGRRQVYNLTYPLSFVMLPRLCPYLVRQILIPLMGGGRVNTRIGKVQRLANTGTMRWLTSRQNDYYIIMKRGTRGDSRPLSVIYVPTITRLTRADRSPIHYYFQVAQPCQIWKQFPFTWLFGFWRLSSTIVSLRVRYEWCWGARLDLWSTGWYNWRKGGYALIH